MFSGFHSLIFLLRDFRDFIIIRKMGNNHKKPKIIDIFYLGLKEKVTILKCNELI